jgi:hypothetical protein
MKILKIVLVTLIVSCQPRQSDKTSDNEVKTLDSTTTKITNAQNEGTLKIDSIKKDSSFQSFFTRFKSDSLFQLQRTIFPFQTLTWKPDDEDPVGQRIEIEEWKILKFIYHDSLAVRENNAYTQEIQDLGLEPQVQIRGVKNSLHINYVFINENGQYKLLRREEYSFGLNPWWTE